MLLAELLLSEMSVDDARRFIKKHDPSFQFDNITPATISKARRALGKKLHPDIGGSEEDMKLANDALDTLEKSGGGFSFDDPYSGRYDDEFGRQYRAYAEKRQRQKEEEGRSKYTVPKAYGGFGPADKTDVPPWAWAGAKGRAGKRVKEWFEGSHGPYAGGGFENYSKNSLLYIKRMAWILSDKPNPSPKSEYQFVVFDGKVFPTQTTVYAAPFSLGNVASLMLEYEKKNHATLSTHAIVVKHGHQITVIPVKDGDTAEEDEWFTPPSGTWSITGIDNKHFIRYLRDRLGLA